jgi:uncharacterized protein DUF4288
MWYIAHELLYFVRKSGKNRARNQKIVAWENLVLISARSAEQAYKKAMKHGHLSEENVRINGDEGYCKLKGLRDLVLIYNDLEDGAELEWHDMRLSPVELNRMARPKARMHAFNPGPKTE